MLTSCIIALLAQTVDIKCLDIVILTLFAIIAKGNISNQLLAFAGKSLADGKVQVLTIILIRLTGGTRALAPPLSRIKVAVQKVFASVIITNTKITSDTDICLFGRVIICSRTNRIV